MARFRSNHCRPFKLKMRFCLSVIFFDLINLGDSEHKKLLDQFRGKTLPKDHRASITVNRVGSRIAKAAQTFCDEHNIPNFKATNPTFTVVRSDMANAFVLPNNHVFVMTGLFQFAQNEDELAAVSR